MEKKGKEIEIKTQREIHPNQNLACFAIKMFNTFDTFISILPHSPINCLRKPIKNDTGTEMTLNLVSQALNGPLMTKNARFDQ